MPFRTNIGRYIFNRGRVSKLALARIDLDRVGAAAEIQYNFIPRTLGSMMLRPGFQYIGQIRNSSTAVLIPYIRTSTETALIELTSTAMRVWRNDAVILRTASTASITESDFSATSLTNWTDADDVGTTSAVYSTGFLSLVGTRYARARRYQAVTSSAGTFGLNVVINRGVVNLRVGSSLGSTSYVVDNYLNEVALVPGYYSFSITTTGNFTVELSANTYYQSRVDKCAIESSGDMVLNTTWASADLAQLRWDQSADVFYVANSSYKPQKILRYSTESWGICEYRPENGPFGDINITNKRLTPSAQTGNITLEADQPVFRSGHVGALFRLTSVGQEVNVTITGADQFSNPIRVAGVDDGRKFQILVTSSTSWVATVRVQRSIGEVGSWENVSGLSFTATIDSTHDDTLDNQIIFYRIGVGSTFTSGNLVGTLSYASGGLTGVARISSVVSATVSSAEVLSDLGSTSPTELWYEGEWSGVKGFPSAVKLHEGRLWWAGKGKVWGSISDAFESFDPDEEGDAGPIVRTIASGGVDHIEWLESLGRLFIGTDSRELQAKTGSLDEPLTPTNFNLRDVSNQGTHTVSSVKVDKAAMFVQRGGSRVMVIGPDQAGVDYDTVDRTALVPEIGEPSISRMAVQRQPDTRVHCVRASSDGTVAMLIREPAEDVTAWIDIGSTAQNGAIEEVAVLPGTIEDSVYYIVRREINGSTVRYLEKWAMEAQAHGGSSNRMADSFVVATEIASTNINGVNFEGSTTFLSRGANLTGNANGKIFTASFWARHTSTASSRNVIYCGSSSTVGTIGLGWSFTSGTFLVEAVSTSGGAALNLGSTRIGSASTWSHYLISIDLNSTLTRHLYVNDQSTGTYTTYNNLNMMFSGTNQNIGRESTLTTTLYSGDLAEVWIAHGQYVDLSQSSNRRLFISSDLKAVPLGSSGATPTGTSPLIYLSGPTTSWETNKGSGGGFTEIGALADASADPPSAVITLGGLDHLVGSSVIAWGSTVDMGSFTVSTTGTITPTFSATSAVVGLPYEGWYKSVKLGALIEGGAGLTQRKRIDHVGLVMADVHAQGLQYGPSTNSTDLDDLPLIERGTTISTDAVNATYDHAAFEFNGVWDTDSRIVLRAVAPRPVTVLGAIITTETREKT